MVEEKETRKLSFPLYVAAFVVTLIILLAGIYIGTIISENAKQDLQLDVAHLSTRLSGTQLMFLLDDSREFCPVYANELSKLEGDMRPIGQKLAFLEDKYGQVDEQLKLEYFNLETESYLLSKKVREKCNDDSVLVLYFYSNKNCEGCKKQGEDLSAAYDSTKRNVKIYSFDGDLGSPIVTAFKTRYNVTSYPTILVNENAHEGIVSSAEIVKLFENA